MAEALGIPVQKNKAVCPLHGDKDPSLSFHGNRFTCFGCGAKGSPIDLVKEVLNVDLQAAAEWIGSRFGISPPERKSGQTAHYKKGPTPTLPSRKIGPHKPNAALSLEHFDVYEALLRLLPENSGEEWLQGRGFPPETASGYMIRRIIDPARLLSRLREGIPDALLLSAGVARKRGEGDLALQWGPGWYLLPILGQGIYGGRIIFLQGRNPLPDGKPKYMEIGGGFPRPLFWTCKGLGAPKGEALYLCEGILDALAAEEIGYPAVAVLGTQALSDEIIRELLPYRIKIPADRDEAGQKFAREASERIRGMGGTVSKVLLPEGVKDVNDYLRSKGKEEL